MSSEIIGVTDRISDADSYPTSACPTPRQRHEAIDRMVEDAVHQRVGAFEHAHPSTRSSPSSDDVNPRSRPLCQAVASRRSSPLGGC